MILLLFCLKICIILLLAFYICKDLLPYSPAHWRSALMCSALLMCVLFPVLMLIVPEWNWPLLSSTAYLDAGEVKKSSQQLSGVAYSSLAKMYIAIALIFLAVQIKNYVILALIHNTSTKWQGVDLPVASTIEVRTHAAIDVPCTYLLNQILLPQAALSWPDDKLRHVLKHEEAHIQRKDWLIQNVFRLLMNVLWFFPPAWFAFSYIKQQSELAADDKVIALYKIDPLEYAEQLLSFHQGGGSPVSTVSFKKQKSLQLRVKALLNPQQERSQVSVFKLMLTLLLTLIFSMLLASINVKASTLPRPELTPWLTKKESVEISDALRLNVKNIPSDIKKPDRSISTAPEFQDYVVEQPELEKSQAYNFANLDVNLPNSAELAYVRIEGYIPKRITTPQYPKRAEDRRIEGYVVVEYDIDETGSVINPRVISAKPKKVFNKSSLKALEHFKFEPQRVNGQAIITTAVRSKFIFSLKPFDAEKYKVPIPPKITGPTAIADLDSG